MELGGRGGVKAGMQRRLGLAALPLLPMGYDLPFIATVALVDTCATPTGVRLCTHATRTRLIGGDKHEKGRQ